MLQKIREDLKNTMKNGDSKKRDVLKLVLAECSKIEHDKNRKPGPLTDNEVIKIIRTQLKSTKEAIVDFEKGGRTDLVDQSNYEINILQSYLPKDLSDEEIEKIINDKIKELSLDTKNIGIIMKHVMPILNGKADGNKVKDIIQKIIK